MQSGVIIFLSLIAGLAFGIVIMFLVSKAGLNKDQQKAEKILRDAQMDALSLIHI